MKKKLLSLCIASISATFGFNYAVAEEAVIYVDGTDSSELSAIIDNQLHFFDDNGVAVLDLPAGEYTAILKNDDALLGEVTFKVSELKHSEVKVIKSLSGLKVTQEQFSPDDDTQEGLVIGRVFMSGGESHLAGAKIRIEGINREVITDASGAYSLSVPRGNHTVFISHPEYAERKIENVRIVSGVATEASLSLAKVSAGIMEEVLILGVRGPADESSLAIERDASSVVSAITAEDFKAFGDSSASDVLKRVTGVSVVGGKYAVVRGLDGRYVATTLDAGVLPSTDPLRRDVPLDLFPSSVLSGINIDKSYSPHLPATSSGGHVGMTLKSRPTEYVNELSLGVKYNSVTTGKNVLSYNGGGRDWTGYDDSSRDLPSIVNNQTNFGANELSQCNPPPFTIPGCDTPEELAVLGKAFSNDFTPKQETAAPGFNIAYSLGNSFSLEAGELGIQAVLDYDQDWSYSDEQRVSIQSDDGVNTFLAEDSRILQSDYTVDLTGMLIAGLEMDSGILLNSKTLLLRKTEDITQVRSKNDLVDEKDFVDTTLQWVERQLINQSFDGFVPLDRIDGELKTRLSFGNTQRLAPDRRTYSYENGNVPDSQIFRNYSELDEDSATFSLDYEQLGAGLFNSEAKYQAGFLASKKDREVRIARFGYRFNDPDLDRTQTLENILTPQNFDNNAVKITTSNLKNDWYEASDDVSAAYVNAEFNWNEQWIVALGGRNEEMKIYLESTGPDATAPPVEKNKNKFYPALNVTWLQSDALQYRFGISQTILAPGLIEINSSSQFDDDNTQIFGNDKLSFSSVENADFRMEYYWDDEQSFSVGLFYKHIDAPIEKGIVDGIPIDRAYTFRQADDGKVLGLEFDLARNIESSSSFFYTYGINLSYIDSEVTLDSDVALREGRTKRQLQGQSEYLANFRFQMEHLNTGQKLSLVGNYFSDRIDVVNNAASGDRVEQGRAVVDLIYIWDINDTWEIGAKIQNLLNSDVEFVEVGNRQESSEIYKAGIDASFKMSYRF